MISPDWAIRQSEFTAQGDQAERFYPAIDMCNAHMTGPTGLAAYSGVDDSESGVVITVSSDHDDSQRLASSASGIR